MCAAAASLMRFRKSLSDSLPPRRKGSFLSHGPLRNTRVPCAGISNGGTVGSIQQMAGDVDADAVERSHSRSGVSWCAAARVPAHKLCGQELLQASESASRMRDLQRRTRAAACAICEAGSDGVQIS